MKLEEGDSRVESIMNIFYRSLCHVYMQAFIFTYIYRRAYCEKDVDVEKSLEESDVG